MHMTVPDDPSLSNWIEEHEINILCNRINMTCHTILISHNDVITTMQMQPAKSSFARAAIRRLT